MKPTTITPAPITPADDTVRLSKRHGRANKYLTGRNVDWKIRKCLTCSQEFESWGAGNRRCPRCDDKLKSPSFRSAREEPSKLNI